MRSHGEPDFPDPSPNGSLKVTTNPNDPQLQAAQRACGSLLPGGGNQTTGGHFTANEVAQLLNFARCMRAHGIVNYPDPTANGMGSLRGVDPNSPQFNTALQACQSLMPHLGGTGPVNGAGSGS
jgi:hypothetical protein